MIPFIIWLIVGFYGASSSAPCEEGWIHDSDEGFGKCYYVNTTKVTQVESVRQCEEMEAYLACPATKNETEFIKQQLNDSGYNETKDNQYWIGLNRAITTEETRQDGWVWLDNTTYDWRNWFVGEPNKWERCARLLPHQDWLWGGAYCDGDEDNHFYFGYICEKNVGLLTTTYIPTTSEAATVTDQTSEQAHGKVTASEGIGADTATSKISEKENNEVTTFDVSEQTISEQSASNDSVFIAVGASAGCLCVLVLVTIVVVIVVKKRRKHHKPAGSEFEEEFEISDNGYEQIPFDGKTKRDRRKQRHPATPSVGLPLESNANNVQVYDDYDTVADHQLGRSSVEYDNPCMVDMNQYADPTELDFRKDKKLNGTKDTSIATPGCKDEDIAALYAKPMKKKGAKEHGKDGSAAGSSTDKLDIEALYAKPDKRKKPGAQEEMG